MIRASCVMRVALFGLALVLTPLGPGAARAQLEEPGSSPEYEALIQRALAEYDAHRFEEARVHFRRAHALFPSARTLRGIGVASFGLADYVTAYVHLTEALADPRRPLTGELRAATEGLRRRAFEFVGKLELAVEPAGAIVRVSGAEPTIVDGVIIVNPGAFTLSISAPGFRDVNETTRVAGGATLSLEFHLTPEPADEPPVSPAVILAPPEAFPPRDEAPQRDPSRRRRRIAILSSIAGVVVVGGVVTLALTVRRDEPYSGTFR